MLQLLVGTDIPFMKFRRFAYILSGALMLVTLGWFFTKGPKYSVDFTGGTLLQVRTSQPVHADQLRQALEAAGLGAEIQQMTGDSQNEYMIRFRTDGDPVTLVQDAVAKRLPGITLELRRNETVGPKVGTDLRQKALMAILTSLGAILLYVGIRYEFKFALGGVVDGFGPYASRYVLLPANAAFTLRNGRVSSGVSVFTHRSCRAAPPCVSKPSYASRSPLSSSANSAGSA